MEESQYNRDLGSASTALAGSLLLYIVLPFLLSLGLRFVLFDISEESAYTLPQSLTGAPALEVTSVPTWLQEKLLPPTLQTASAPADADATKLQMVQLAYVVFVGFILYYAGFAFLLFLMLFRLIIRNWREQTRTGTFNPERLRSLSFNFTELAVVFGCPFLIAIVLGFPNERSLERILLDWTDLPGLHVPRWQIYFLFVAIFLHIAASWERGVCLMHTLIYQVRCGAIIRRRPRRARRLGETLDMDYIGRIAHDYAIAWVPGKPAGRPRPRWRSDWYLKGKPGAHPIYDVWRCGCGYAANILHGTHNGRGIYLFDYHYCRDVMINWGAGVFDFVTESSPRDSTIAVLELPSTLPALSIYPKTVWDDLAAYGGGITLEMESIEFSEAYRVWAQDCRFAFAVCNPQMMAFLSDHPRMALRISGNVLSLRLPGLLPVDRLVSLRERLYTTYTLVPKFVFTEASPAVVRKK